MISVMISIIALTVKSLYVMAILGIRTNEATVYVCVP